MAKVPVSVVVITKNEEDNIADCLKSALRRSFGETGKPMTRAS